MASNKKGVILFIVLATVLIVVILAGVILSLISSQSRLTNHQVSRIKAYYAAKGIMNYTLEKLRTGEWSPGAMGTCACHRQDNGPLCGVVCSTMKTIPADPDIPYTISVLIYPNNSAPNNTDLNGKVTQIDIKTQYTYTP